MRMGLFPCWGSRILKLLMQKMCSVTENFLILHNFMHDDALNQKELANFSEKCGHFAKISERFKNPLANFLFECYSFTCKKKPNSTKR